MDVRAIGGGVLAAAFALAVSTGCMPDVPQDEASASSRTQPVLDPAAETLPLPNDAALEDDGTLPQLDGWEEESARGVFLSWLGELHGWLASTPIEIPFDGPLAEETLEDGAIHLFRIGDDEELEKLEIGAIDYRETAVEISNDAGDLREVEGSVVEVSPAESLESHARYAVVVTKAVEGADGESIVEPEPIFFAASAEPLVDENGEKTIESLPDDATAQQLEGLRQLLEPVFEGLESQEIERDDVAMAFRWSTVRDPMTVVDPETATVPLPNTAALDRGPEHPAEQQETFPAAALDTISVETEDGEPVHVAEETAQGHFEAYLDRLHGWPPPPQTPITLPIDGSVDETTVGPETVQVWRQPAGDGEEPVRVELEEVRYNSEEEQIEVVPASPLAKRHRFVAFATDDIGSGAPGEEESYSLKLPAALQMAIQEHPILEDDASTVDRISDEQARAIDELRSFMRPAATFVEEEADTSIDDLGAIWTWETWTDTFAVFDPAGGSLPFPHSLLRDDETGQISLPTEGLEGAQRAIVEELNRKFGFSTTAPGWIPMDGPVDETTVSEESVQVIRRTGSIGAYASDRYEVEYAPDWSQVLLEPTVPFVADRSLDPVDDEEVLNIGVVRKSMKGANGYSVMPSPTFVFLRSPEPLYSGGESTVDQLTDEQAEQLEASRSAFSQLLFLAESGGVNGFELEDRSELALGYPFHPENPTQQFQELRAQAIAKFAERAERSAERACARDQSQDCSADPNEIEDPGSSHQGPGGSGTAVDMSNVERIQWAAEFETIRFIDSNGELSGYDEAQPETVGLSVFVPDTADGECDESPPFDVAILQHGLGSHRVRLGMALANELAGRCVASVAMDFPGHGGRAPGAESLHPSTNPGTSGETFFTADLIRTKNNVLQSGVDVALLAQLIAEGGLETAIDEDGSTDFFADGEGAEIGYVGHSLGGFVGFPTATVDSNINVTVFHGVGGGYADVLTGGVLAQGILETFEEAGLEEGTFGRFRVLSFIQWLADPVDPLAFAPFIREAPVRSMTYDPESGYATGESLEANEVLLQMARDPGEMDDTVVPNATTERLAASAGLTVDESTYAAPHGFLVDLDDQVETFVQTECARRQAAAWVASGLEGEASYDSELIAANCTGN